MRNGVGVVDQLPLCPACRLEPADLVHILAVCPCTAAFRQHVPPLERDQVVGWTLAGSGDPALLRLMVCHVGLSLAVVAHALGDREAPPAE